jgi:hypothetical protein
MALKKSLSHTGYHWRDEVVSKLLRCRLERIDRNTLNNILRGYVPSFSHFFTGKWGCTMALAIFIGFKRLLVGK